MSEPLRWFIVLVWGGCVSALCAEQTPRAGDTPLLAEAMAAKASSDKLPARAPDGPVRLEMLAEAAAEDLASTILSVKVPEVGSGRTHRILPSAGKPGDVRLVVSTTDLAVRKRWLAPKIPIPPFIQWGRWMDAHKDSTHCSLDWMDAQGLWWHTELRAYNHHPAKYRVGQGEFPGTGLAIYGVFILPGRTDLENHDLVADELLEMDYSLIEPLAREYGRKNKHPGEPGTGGNGSRNVGLGGPAFKPSQNSNTYVSYLLRRAGVKHPKPPRAVGWNTKPHFPYSSDAAE